MDPLTAALQGVILPALVSAALLAIAWRPWRRPGQNGAGPEPATTLSPALSAAAMGLGVIASDLLIRGWQGLWPIATTNFVPHATLVAIITGTLASWGRLRLLGRVAMVLLGALVCTYLLTQHRVKSQWTGLERVAWLAGLTLVPTVLALACEAWARRFAGARLAILVWLAFSAAAVVLLFSGSAALGQVTGAFAATTGPFVLLAWWRRDLRAMVGAGVVAGLMLPSMLTVQFYKDVPMVAAGLVAAIPLLVWLSRFGPMRQLPGWLATLVCVMLGAGLAGGAIAISAPKPEDNPLLYDQMDP